MGELLGQRVITFYAFDPARCCEADESFLSASGMIARVMWLAYKLRIKLGSGATSISPC
jgi:hypothetical protein